MSAVSPYRRRFYQGRRRQPSQPHPTTFRRGRPTVIEASDFGVHARTLFEAAGQHVNPERGLGPRLTGDQVIKILKNMESMRSIQPGWTVELSNMGRAMTIRVTARRRFSAKTLAYYGLSTISSL